MFLARERVPDHLVENSTRSAAAQAGHYIPHLAKWLADHGSAPSISVKGLMIGNGWTEPKFQSLRPRRSNPYFVHGLSAA